MRMCAAFSQKEHPLRLTYFSLQVVTAGLVAVSGCNAPSPFGR